MATKRICIEPVTLITILNAARDAAGRPLIPAVGKFQCRKAWYDAKSHQFEMEVESDAFNEHPGSARLPQAFNVTLKK